MSIEALIEEVGKKIMGYGGYRTRDVRQDTMDVFVAHFHGRLKKRMDDLESFRKSSKDNDLKLPISQLLIALGMLLKHSKYAPEKIIPFMQEIYFFEEEFSRDLVRLDHKILEVEGTFSKKTENLKDFNQDLLRECMKMIQSLHVLFKERTRRINALNRSYHVIQGNLKNFCEKIHTQKIGKETIKGLDALIKKYPERVETFSKIMEMFHENRGDYEDYTNPALVKTKYEAFKSYLEHFPKYLKAAKELAEKISPRCEDETKSLETLKKSLDHSSNFEELQKKLEEANKKNKEKIEAT